MTTQATPQRVDPEGVWTHYTLADGLPQMTLEALYEDHQGRLWVGTHARGAACFDGHHFQPYTVQDGLAGPGVFGIIEDELRPYTVPIVCPLCGGKVHTKKAYHLGLDSQGRAYISREIFERLVLRRIPGVMLQASTDPVVSDQLPIKQHSPPALSVVRRGRKEN